ncbi:RHS repeat-associated core domain-containing protein [Cysteiniphilum halobium]|uniref:RHS repeat-associated core domain-containing protein n=1 Tax=Cysteiniphilum halobium TaxID=2219059 RepID=UPI000E64B246|nr:RHS repeat-associated core domain-containing protein [Cysteiniphilum halobium]
MLNNKSKLSIGMGMSCLLITQSMAYSLDSIKSINNQSVNHQRVLVSSAIHYNANGNMSTDNKGSSFSYNAANALTQVSLASGAKESEYYYANGLRAVARSNTQVLVHYYSRNNALLNSSDGTQQSSAYLIANNVAVRSVNGNATVLLHNRHGSVIAQLGDKPQFYQYSVYGVQRTEDGGQRTENGSDTLDLATNPLRYSGYMFDPLTGLYYLKARDYDPNLRSFIQADSYAFNNQGLINGYFYGNNNPLMGVDPSGHDWFEKNSKWLMPIIGIGIGFIEGGVAFGLAKLHTESPSPIPKVREETTYFRSKEKYGEFHIAMLTPVQEASVSLHHSPVPVVKAPREMLEREIGTTNVQGPFHPGLQKYELHTYSQNLEQQFETHKKAIESYADSILKEIHLSYVEAMKDSSDTITHVDQLNTIYDQYNKAGDIDGLYKDAKIQRFIANYIGGATNAHTALEALESDNIKFYRGLRAAIMTVPRSHYF